MTGAGLQESSLGDAFAHCAGMVREEDRPRYTARLFLPVPAREAALALDAFRLETLKIPFLTSEPGPGEIRLQWWREVIEGARAAEAAAAPEDEPDPEVTGESHEKSAGVARIDVAALSAESFATETVPVDAPDAKARATDFDDDDTIEIDAGAMEPRPRRSGFALGFGLVALLAAILILTYANARVIAETVPQLDPALDNYVGMVNQGRVWLDTRVSMMLPK